MLTSIIGDVRTGKTLLCTHLSLKYSCNFPDRPIYSNYKLRLPNYHELKPEMLNDLNENCLVDMDEAYRYLESRVSTSEINRYFSYILFQSGKRGLEIILTDQLPDTIDTRYRRMINYVIECERHELGFAYRIRKISKYKQYQPKTYLMPFEYAETLYPLYDSWELIPIDKKLVYSVTQDKTSFIQDVDNRVTELLKLAPAKAYTKGIIENYCLRNNLHYGYIGAIYNTIKSRIIVPIT